MKQPKFGTPKLIHADDLKRANEADQAQVLTAKRALREPLLRAWDIHKANIAYGVEVESEDEHKACVAWYNALKDLEEWAFEQIPDGVKKHLGGGR